MGVASRLATKNKEVGISNFRLSEAHESFTKGNPYTQFLSVKEWKKYRFYRRTRITLFISFVISILFI